MRNLGSRQAMPDHRAGSAGEVKPLYYLYAGKTFLFGSEIKAILAHPDVKPQFNRSTLAEYLAFGYIAGAASIAIMRESKIASRPHSHD